jgi:hypothetical protein
MNLEDECVICREQFKDRLLMILPCNIKHVFHSTCITEWFQKSTSCPLCKADIHEAIIFTNEILDYLPRPIQSNSLSIYRLLLFLLSLIILILVMSII